MGLLNGLEDYYAFSNRESGLGRYDICLKFMEADKPAVLMEKLKNGAARHYSRFWKKSMKGNWCGKDTGKFSAMGLLFIRKAAG